MSSATLSERLGHILEAIAQIESRIGGDFDAFSRDRFLQLGVERCLEIISEASRHIPEEAKLRHSEIPWRRMADMGNRLRHTYNRVDSAIVWEVATKEIGELRKAIEAINAERSTEVTRRGRND